MSCRVSASATPAATEIGRNAANNHAARAAVTTGIGPPMFVVRAVAIPVSNAIGERTIACVQIGAISMRCAMANARAPAADAAAPVVITRERLRALTDASTAGHPRAIRPAHIVWN